MYPQQSGAGNGAANPGALDFGREHARRAAQLRAHLAAQGKPIGPYDVLIAGQALSRDLTVITHDTREFQRMPGFRVEDWQ